ncbi:MAG TPA: hypothetical protein VGN07_10845 [Steroidobacteraceae bacterium]|jgi:hypothetical protein
MPSFEILLPLGAIAFYLFDSAALLSTRELLFERQRKRWQVLGGSDFLLLGRRPVLPNPLTPYRSIFLISWHDDVNAAESSTATIDAFTRALRPIQWIVSLLLALLLVAIPMASLLYGAAESLLVLFAVFYLLMLVALAIVVRRRKVLSLSGKECFALAMHILLCAPFAVNLVRRLSLRWKLPATPLQFANSNFDASARSKTIELIKSRVDQTLQTLDPETPRAVRLIEFRQRLEGSNT